MKRLKMFVLVVLAVFALATASTGCSMGKVCYGTKVGNHR